MKLKLKDENGYPLNFNQILPTFYQTPERFFPIPQSFYNSDPEIYSVSTWGRIYNNKTGRYVPKVLIPETNRYIITIIKNIYNEEVSVVMHQLVAKMFVVPKPVILGKLVMPNHIDGIKWHNEPYNLEWVTNSENVKHAENNNLIERAHGEDNGWAALTDNQYREICRLTQEGYMPNEINKIMNVGKDITNIVQKIRSGQSETIISKDYDFSNIPTKYNSRIYSEDVKYICSCLQNHPEMDYVTIINGIDNPGLKLRNINSLCQIVDDIKNRKCYKYISKDYNF